SGQEHANQDGDDGDDHEQFDQRESGSRFHGRHSKATLRRVNRGGSDVLTFFRMLPYYENGAERQKKRNALLSSVRGLSCARISWTAWPPCATEMGGPARS